MIPKSFNLEFPFFIFDFPQDFCSPSIYYRHKKELFTKLFLAHKILAREQNFVVLIMVETAQKVS